MTKDHPNHKWWTLFAMCFALFMIMLDNTVVNVALPTIQRSLHITNPENLEWTVNGYVLTFAALILLGGKLGDRFGRKRIFLVGLAIFTLASAACAVATTDTQLIAFRSLQGVGGALLNPLSLSILVSAFPRKQLPTAIGVWAGISGLGLAIGPLLGGFLVENVSWSAVFWINVPIGVIAAGVTWWAVVESSDTTTKTLDVIGTVLVTAALFSLTWGLIKTGSHSWTSPYTLFFLGGAAVLFAAFIWREARTREPMLPLSFFQSRVFSASSAVVLMVGFAMFGIFYFVTLYFQNVLGYSALQAGVRSLPLTMMVIFVAPIAGRMSGRVPPRYQMTVGMLLMTAGLLLLSRLQVDSSYNMIWPRVHPRRRRHRHDDAGRVGGRHGRGRPDQGGCRLRRDQRVPPGRRRDGRGRAGRGRVDPGRQRVDRPPGAGAAGDRWPGQQDLRGGDHPGPLAGVRTCGREPGADRLRARRPGGDAGGRGAGLLGRHDSLLRAAARAGREPGH